jgi:antitoxin component YwqK of YwqJK toxin-antitoxin module
VEDGTRFAGSFRDGEKHGKWTVWYENGQKREEGEYRDDAEEGTWRTWKNDGTPNPDEQWRAGARAEGGTAER